MEEILDAKVQERAVLVGLNAACFTKDGEMQTDAV